MYDFSREFYINFCFYQEKSLFLNTKCSLFTHSYLCFRVYKALDERYSDYKDPMGEIQAMKEYLELGLTNPELWETPAEENKE